jgi:hypothetical protein
LGWSEIRFSGSTLAEFNFATAGYWRNWERKTGWLMREIVYTLIAGNPYIEAQHKPASSQVYFPLSDDKRVNEDKPKPKQPTAEELEATRQELLNLMNKK